MSKSVNLKELIISITDYEDKYYEEGLDYGQKILNILIELAPSLNKIILYKG